MAGYEMCPLPFPPPKTSLYVGDLDPRVTPTDLFQVFSEVGKVRHVRLCRDSVTGDSLRYGYVNFFTPQDALRAMHSLNHTALKGKTMRIMWCQRDPLLRKTGVGNLFVKNLDPSINSARLQAIFDKFGTTLSCKVAEENGKSKGFGFIQFDKEDSAIAALNAMHDTLLEGKKLYVAKFLRKSQREAANEQKFTNLYVKNLDEDITEDDLRNKFSKFGTVSNAVIMRDTEGKPRGFGFVSFSSPFEAKAAVKALNGATLGSKHLFVGRAQKKAEREDILKCEWEHLKSRREKSKASTIHVKNLDRNVDEDILEAHFRACGRITSAKIMRDDNGFSKGFGFVSFSSPAEAKKALFTLNGSSLQGKNLYLGIAQRKQERQRALHDLFYRAAIEQFSASAAYPGYPAANPDSHVNSSQQNGFSENLQPVRNGSIMEVQLELPVAKLLKLLQSSPNPLTALVEKTFLNAKGGKFQQWR
ncbi:hypothetical protein Ancab_012291 [Ancistrocladus abbreviatus]